MDFIRTAHWINFEAGAMNRILMLFKGLVDPKTQKATAFYCLLGVLCADIWHRGIHKWNLAALILFAGIGSIGALAQFIRDSTSATSSPEEPKN